MTIVTATDAWSDEITTTNETIWQVQEGQAYLVMGAPGLSAPASTTDGVRFSEWEAMIIPAGSSFRHVSGVGDEATIHYHEMS